MKHSMSHSHCLTQQHTSTCFNDSISLISCGCLTSLCFHSSSQTLYQQETANEISGFMLPCPRLRSSQKFRGSIHSPSCSTGSQRRRYIEVCSSQNTGLKPGVPHNLVLAKAVPQRRDWTASFSLQRCKSIQKILSTLLSFVNAEGHA